MFGLPSASKRRRYRQIASALTRHGLGALTNQLGLAWLIPFQWGILGHPRRKEPYSTGEHLRMAMEDLGATAIKVGQILSTRPDLVPPEISVELEKLRDRVPPVSTAAIREVIERELCCRADEVFADFEDEPLAGASIGQVHAATLRDGSRVVVKVRKPGVLETVTTDLEILSDLARRAARANAFGGRYDLEALAQDFARTLRAELDYMREGKNADRLREILADEPRVVIPNIRWDYTTEAVLVMERIDGTRISDVVVSPDLRSESGPSLAKTSAEILMKQVFEAGFYHADPHPGNFLVLEDGRLGLLDFGMVGHLDEQMQHSLLRLLAAIVRQDAYAVTDCLDGIGILRSASERDSVRRDAHYLIQRYYGLSVDQFAISDYINDITAVVRSHELQLPTELALVLKTVAMSEGLWRQLDPRFNAIRVAASFAESAMAKMYYPSAWARRAFKATSEMVELGTELPGQLHRIATRLDRGEFELALRHRDLDETIDRLSGMVSRLSTAIVAAAFILGLPFLVTAWKPPAWDILAPLWFFGGLVAAAGLIVRLALAGRRRNR